MLQFAVAVVGKAQLVRSLTALQAIDPAEILALTPEERCSAPDTEYDGWLNEVRSLADVTVLLPLQENPRMGLTDTEAVRGAAEAVAHTTSSWILILQSGEFITPADALTLGAVVGELEGGTANNMALWIEDRSEWQTRMTCHVASPGAVVRVAADRASIKTFKEHSA